MTDALLQGARNCAVDCAQVQKGQTVALVNQRGAVEEAVVDALVHVVEEQAADLRVVWADGIPKDRPEAIPQDVLSAYRDADIVIASFPSLDREALHPHFPGESRVRVPNRADSAALLSSGWARFPYSLQRALAEAVDALSRPGAEWRVTAPDGTNIRGRFVAADSVVGQAYFVQSEGGRARRNFPGGVHNPQQSTDVSGRIVAAYVDGFARFAPVELEFENGQAIAVRGGDEAGAIRARIAQTDGFLDSWHAGVNPETIVPADRDRTPKAWFGYAHCSPQWLHFHLGRSHAPLNLAISDHTITVDGRKIYDRGRLTLIEQPDIRDLARRAGVSATVFDLPAAS